MSAPSEPTPQTVMPRDGWSDGPYVSTLFAGGHLIAQIHVKSLDAYDLTRQNANEDSRNRGNARGPLWIGREADLDATKKQVQVFFLKNGQGAGL